MRGAAGKEFPCWLWVVGPSSSYTIILPILKKKIIDPLMSHGQAYEVYIVISMGKSAKKMIWL